MVAGGTESPIARLALAGFCRLPGAVDELQRPPDRGLASLRPRPRRLRDGRGRRRRRPRGARARPGARRHASMARSSATACPATPTTSPPPPRTATAPSAACGAAMKRAGVSAGRHRLHQRPRHLDAARRRDRAAGGRARCSATAAGKVSMSSTKSATGHLLGAAGAVEAIFSLLAIRDNVAPPTLNLDNPSVETPIDLVPRTPKKMNDRRGALQLVRLRRHQRFAWSSAAIPDCDRWPILLLP